MVRKVDMVRMLTILWVLICVILTWIDGGWGWIIAESVGGIIGVIIVACAPDEWHQYR